MVQAHTEATHIEYCCGRVSKRGWHMGLGSLATMSGGVGAVVGKLLEVRH